MVGGWMLKPDPWVRLIWVNLILVLANIIELSMGVLSAVMLFNPV